MLEQRARLCVCEGKHVSAGGWGQECVCIVECRGAGVHTEKDTHCGGGGGGGCSHPVSSPLQKCTRWRFLLAQCTGTPYVAAGRTSTGITGVKPISSASTAASASTAQCTSPVSTALLSPAPSPPQSGPCLRRVSAFLYSSPLTPHFLSFPLPVCGTTLAIYTTPPSCPCGPRCRVPLLECTASLPTGKERQDTVCTCHAGFFLRKNECVSCAK